jgi:hypothetical protein
VAWGRVVVEGMRVLENVMRIYVASEEMGEEAYRAPLLREFVRHLAEGYDTILQRHRLTITRARPYGCSICDALKVMRLGIALGITPVRRRGPEKMLRFNERIFWDD